MKAGSTKASPKYNVVVKDGPDGTFKIAIVVTDLRVRRIRRNLIQIADIEAMFPATFTYKGHRFRPKLILKLHRKFTSKMANRLNMSNGSCLETKFI